MSLVVFRCDGDPSIGSGHVMRCLALSTVFAEAGWRIGFAASEESFRGVAALRASNVERLVVPVGEGEAAAIAARWPEGAEVLVVDHYGRDAVFERTCRPWAKRIVVLDDLADRPHDADAVFDAAAPSAALYRDLVPPSCRIHVGPQFAIVHPSFRAARARALSRRTTRAVQRVLVSFGQIDSPNATTHALAALEEVAFKGEVDVVLGSAAPHLAQVQGAAGGQTRVLVDVTDMPALMSMADLAIGAGGVTAWERACLGLPAIVVEIADNQRRIISVLQREGAALSAGRMHAGIERSLSIVLDDILSNSEKRAAIALAAGKLVDGNGSVRILETVS